MATHSSIVAYGKRSLAGHNPWGRKELDTTEETLAHTVLAGRTPGSSETFTWSLALCSWKPRQTLLLLTVVPHAYRRSQ